MSREAHAVLCMPAPLTGLMAELESLVATVGSDKWRPHGDYNLTPVNILAADAFAIRPVNSRLVMRDALASDA
jgi:hypothetical protein